MNAAEGGYDTTIGWAPQQRTPVPPHEGVAPPDALGRDDLTFKMGRWVMLAEHCCDVERETQGLIAAYDDRLTGVSSEQLRAATVAGRYHDLGKAHLAFQQMLLSTVEAGTGPPAGVWAKSGRGGGRHERPYFRHELVSALMLLHPECGLLEDEEEPDLITYLVAAHHGKVRMSIRSLAGEAEHEPPRVLGVQNGDEIPRIEVPDGQELPALVIDPGRLMLGDAAEGQESWTSRVLRLRDREDLGPFRLTFLETLVRMGDWRASRAYRMEIQ
jgi:CRISPR-associated endonuclease/helicase Cas3